MTRLNRAAFIAIVLLAPALFAQRLSATNFTKTPAQVTTYQIQPVQTYPVTQAVGTNASVGTDLLVDEKTIISLKFQQLGNTVFPTPLLVSNVKDARLDTLCYTEPAPCVFLTPAATFPVTPQHDIDAGNRFLSHWRTRVQACLSGVISTRGGVRYFRLGNGLITHLTGDLSKLPSRGPACLCGVRGLSDETITFEVTQVCPTGK